MEYKKNGELSEVYYYKKLVPDEKAVGEETGAGEVQVPQFGLKDIVKRKPLKYKKPKFRPKVNHFS